MGKILEIIINNRIKAYLLKNDLLIPEQFGFRPKHFTTQQLVRLTDSISTEFNKNRSTALLLLDIEKAFDTIWRKALIYKLNVLNIPIYLIKWIDNYLKNRKFSVVVGEGRSTTRNIAAGVPQGSILGPILFLIYINDIPKYSKINLALFADDTAIYTSSFSKDMALKNIQNHILLLEKYYNKWKIKINVGKTQIILFSHKQKPIKTQVHMYGQQLTQTNEAKYLGLTVDPKLTFSNQIKTIARKANSAVALLYPLICRKSDLSQSNKLIIYKMCILPIMLYVCPVWSNTCFSNYNRLQIIQNKILRMISNAQFDTRIREMHNQLYINYIHDIVKLHSIKFFNQKLNLSILSNVCNAREINSYYKYKLPQHIIMKNS